MKKVNYPKKGAARKWAKRLEELGKHSPPDELMKKINKEENKKVNYPKKGAVENAAKRFEKLYRKPVSKRISDFLKEESKNARHLSTNKGVKMKLFMTFKLPEDHEQYDDAINGTKNKIKLDEIWNRVFRPHYKHGYSDDKLNKLLNSKNGEYIMEKLTEIYREVINEE